MGSVLTIWPVNLDNPLAFDFNGNSIETISELEKPKIKSKEAELDELDELEKFIHTLKLATMLFISTTVLEN